MKGTVTVKQVDTGSELKRVTWQMMRNIVVSTIQEIETMLNEMCLPGQVHICAKSLRFILTNCQDIDLGQIKDFEDPAIGAGILTHNANMFDDHAQVCTVLN